jgi:hypothetical protein
MTPAVTNFDQPANLRGAFEQDPLNPLNPLNPMNPLNP